MGEGGYQIVNIVNKVAVGIHLKKRSYKVLK
jgi:hypothetical protein